MRKLIAVMTLVVSMLIATPLQSFAYTVKSGDTMSQIAIDNNMSLQELSDANPQVTDLNTIFVGENVNFAISPSSKLPAYFKATSEERDLLARLVHAEADGEPYAGQVAVAIVILNRVDSSDFPNSISSVIYQTGQFQPVENGTINEQADSTNYKAVDEAFHTDRSKGDGSLYFYNPVTSTSHWLDSLPTTLVIGHHVFKK